MLGHAIEYLMDSYVLYSSKSGDANDQKAVHILENLFLTVFRECEEVESNRDRIIGGLCKILGLEKT